eukprot:Nk52_evm2s303 gene=Nk52_evmTU2s303
MDVEAKLKEVREKITAAEQRRKKTPDSSSSSSSSSCCLVAVTKTKPPAAIRMAYNSGQRHFGENYIQEFREKVPQLPDDIKWHFIGHIQSNKVKDVLYHPNLYMIETIDSKKIAKAVDAGWGKKIAAAAAAKAPSSSSSSAAVGTGAQEDQQQSGKVEEQLGNLKLNNGDDDKGGENRNQAMRVGRLKVLVQVNTSLEKNKYGVMPEDTVDLVRYVKEQCPHLELCGLMTIGMFDREYGEEGNPDFLCLLECRDNVCAEFGLKEDQVKLSMGMSADYEHAVELGSSYVRVGSTIFGARERKAT